MNRIDCAQARELLLAAEVLAEESLSPELQSHLHECQACRNTLAKLHRMDEQARMLPPPEASESAKQDFLQQLRPLPNPARPSSLHWPFALRWNASMAALAATLILLSGLAVWLLISDGTSTAIASDTVVDRLVNWNMDLADAVTPQEQGRIFSQSASLQQAMDRNSTPASERDLAKQLLENGTWLKTNTDPLDRAERFGQLADLLFKRLGAAVAKGDTKAAARLSRYLGLVTSRGVDTHLDRAESSVVDQPDRRHRYHKAAQKRAELREQLDVLLKQVPDVTRKQMLRELGLPHPDRKAQHRNHP